MNEVSSQTVMLLIDALTHRGVDVPALWSGMGIDIRVLQQHPRRIDWETWVEMMVRAEAACGEEHTERLFVPGAGARAKHGFVQLANAFLSVDDVFALFARWGLSRSLMVISARFDADARRFTVTIDRERIGSLPTLRFIAGILRSLPSLQGLPFATVEVEPGATTHTASYALGLPQVPSLRTRARRLFRVARGANAALDELEEQAAEIASKNAALTRQLAETERAAAALREREEWLALALAAGQVGIWEWHPTGRVRLSEGLGELFGFPGQLEIDATAWTARIH
ncbi:MAG: hypothetical protein NT062_05930, partial [Proteobacteria bacterium]|nr:hypothetical protein [Pseudomonadota bacterium]